MEVYTYSDARQHLAALLDTAAATGKVIIRRRDGTTFVVAPESAPASPLDVPPVMAPVGVAEIIDIIRECREREPACR
ncbi:MAG: type II toxin-antitoxin system Phd/YefM family antitoxin [Armatimonadetes bacterium]|nr:type II toxin-antitoxin system Phd/YefM family antitoxin [Armatimonadota bacterium]